MCELINEKKFIMIKLQYKRVILMCQSNTNTTTFYCNDSVPLTYNTWLHPYIHIYTQKERKLKKKNKKKREFATKISEKKEQGLSTGKIMLSKAYLNH